MATGLRIVVVGGGIAGISIAAELSRSHEVTLLETEGQLAHHTTGRSAAMYLGSYGNPVIQELTADSFDLYSVLSEEHGSPLLTPRDMVQVLDHSQVHEVEATLADNSTMVRVTVDELMSAAPYVRPGIVGAVLRDDTGYEIDVAGLHQAYVRRLMRNGGVIRRTSEVLEVGTGSGSRTVRTAGETFAADLVVNAAGAWGDVLAERAGCAPVGLSPLRRTIFTSRLRESHAPGPMIVRHPEDFYFRVDNGTVMGSPADETPSEPCDARPDEIDVARAIDSINEFTNLAIRSVDSAWAGLRTFTADKTPVVGCRASEPHFFWLCGQGGYGIQMAPGLAALAASIINGTVDAGKFSLVTRLSPERF